MSKRRSKRLADWIRCRGGTVHPHLNMFVDNDGKGENRCVVAEKPIRKGEVLIRLTTKSYFDASRRRDGLPKECRSEEGIILTALCMMRYMLVKGNDDAYVECLNGTKIYLTKDKVVTNLLKGSSAYEEYISLRPEMILWHKGGLRRTVLNYPDIWPCDEKKVDAMFERVCGLVRTRGFYDEQNRGPYMLPGMDMLNHCNDQKRTSTTLFVDDEVKDGEDRALVFLMIAERDIKKDEEITHTYLEMNDSLLFMTYGIVNDRAVPVPRISRSVILRAIMEAFSESFGETTMKEFGEAIRSKKMKDCNSLIPHGFVSLKNGESGIHQKLWNIASLLAPDDTISMLCRIYKFSLEEFDSTVRRDSPDHASIASSPHRVAAFALARREYTVLKSAYSYALRLLSSSSNGGI